MRLSPQGVKGEEYRPEEVDPTPTHDLSLYRKSAYVAVQNRNHHCLTSIVSKICSGLARRSYKSYKGRVKASPVWGPDTINI